MVNPTRVRICATLLKRKFLDKFEIKYEFETRSKGVMNRSIRSKVLVNRSIKSEGIVTRSIISKGFGSDF